MAASEGVGKNIKISTEEQQAKDNEISPKTHTKRPICERCKRPTKVCLCRAIPDKPLNISTTVYILQHPEERHRTLTTVPLLSACLPNDKCIVYNDVRYSHEKYPALHQLLKRPETLVLYPDASATDLRKLVKEASASQKYNLVVPDGTWRQAKKIFKQNSALQQARKVQLNENIKSRYVIRTQPTRNSLSTLEAIAVALSILEGKDEITEVLRKPLQLLCDIQLEHGAVPHSSKEEKREQEVLKQKQSEDIKKLEIIEGSEDKETNLKHNRTSHEHETELSSKRSKLTK
ncbi:DTW domain-containing protein 2-like [Dendronephthya gigantea]|uniref:DTW domain-containing protein 2-like n=1 Tax=Dendronephthya gigantea TaxID=151771 RepID=UPI00106D2A94|nr:DTW domain-containing protein 2-like [Dendronephthya gigantea]